MGNVPKLRFGGFSGEWEKHRLGELVQFSKGTGYSKGDLKEWGTPIILYGRLYTKYETVISDVDTYAEPQPGAIYSCGGEVIVPASGETAEDISIASVVEKTGVLLGGDLNIITPPADIDSAFLAISISNGKPHSDMAKMAQGKSIVHLHNTDLEKIVFPYPSIVEQRRISDSYRKLEYCITLLQRKCDALANAKKFYLQNLFPRKGTRTPALRFDGFTGDWGKLRLGDIVERVTRKNSELLSELPLTISAQYGLIDQREFFDRQIASKDVSGYYLIKRGEFAYNKSTSADAPWGAIKRLDKYDMGVLSTLYIVFRIIDESKTCSDYVCAYYDTDLWHTEIRAIAAEGARNHGLLNITPSDFFDTMLTIPPSIEEQRQISSFFNSLDTLIAQQTRKLSALKAMKQFMLQNMFV